MAKGYSKLEAKRLAQQATTQLALSRLAMMEAVIPDRGWQTITILIEYENDKQH